MYGDIHNMEFDLKTSIKKSNHQSKETEEKSKK